MTERTPAISCYLSPHKLGQLFSLRAFGNSRRVAEKMDNVFENKNHSIKRTEVAVQRSSKDINLHTWDEDPKNKSKLKVGRPYFAEHVSCHRLFVSESKLR